MIAGASAGIGAATAEQCARAGMRVALAARRADRLRELAEKLQSLGAETLEVVCDVRLDADVRDLIDQTIDRFGRIDVLFANAGYGFFESTLDAADEQIRDIFETNFFGTIRCIRAALPHMIAAGRGHILITSSAASEISIPNYGYYAATKAAQDSIGGALRAEVAPSGIDVTTIHPIGTVTEFFDVTEQVSRNAGGGLNTPRSMMQSADHVARCIVRCLRKPKPEVWPSTITRFALAATTAFPRLSAWLLNRIARRSDRVERV